MSTTPYAGLTKPTVGADDNAWGDLLNADLDIIDQVLRQIVPAGSIFPYAGASTPTGFLLCNGQVVSRATYAALFAAIGTTWGAGDGSTTFGVPNLGDRFPIGVGTSHALGAIGGAPSFTPTIAVAGHALTIPELPSHGHGVTDPQHGHSVNDPPHNHGVSDPQHSHTILNNVDNNGPFTANHAFGSANGAVQVWNTASEPASTGITLGSATTGVSVNGAATGISIQSAGGGGAHTHDATSSAVPTVPPFAAVNYIIKV
jgi:microcystin-dependent protein